jgi:hypothetical protein
MGCLLVALFLDVCFPCLDEPLFAAGVEEVLAGVEEERKPLGWESQPF